MVVAQRIGDVADYVRAGHAVAPSYSFSGASGRLIVKCRIGAAPNSVPVGLRTVLLQSLQPLQSCVGMHVIVDRGHHFSDGHAFANFWITPESGSHVHAGDHAIHAQPQSRRRNDSTGPHDKVDGGKYTTGVVPPIDHPAQS